MICTFYFSGHLSPMIGHNSHQIQASQQHHHQEQSLPKRKRSWSRAVFSHLQRKGLEKRFEVQKYVTKPDRRQLAAMLGLTDAQVKRFRTHCHWRITILILLIDLVKLLLVARLWYLCGLVRMSDYFSLE